MSGGELGLMLRDGERRFAEALAAAMGCDAAELLADVEAERMAEAAKQVDVEAYARRLLGLDKGKGRT